MRAGVPALVGPGGPSSEGWVAEENKMDRERNWGGGGGGGGWESEREKEKVANTVYFLGK